MTNSPGRFRFTLYGVGVVMVVAAACGSDKVDVRAAPTAASASPTEQVSFASPTDGATVTSPVTVTLTATNFVVEPAGEVHAGAGHLHVMVDVGCVAVGTVIPKDDAHVHLGKAELSKELVLAPGTHKLCLQAGDGAHAALDLTDEIEVTVSG